MKGSITCLCDYSIKDEEKYDCKFTRPCEGCHSSIEGKRNRRFNMQGIGRVPLNKAVYYIFLTCSCGVQY